MVGPLGVLLVDPAAATTRVQGEVDGGPPRGVLSMDLIAATIEVVEDVDGGPPWGCCRCVQ
jgi:hypothetical protein